MPEQDKARDTAHDAQGQTTAYVDTNTGWGVRYLPSGGLSVAYKGVHKFVLDKELCELITTTLARRPQDPKAVRGAERGDESELKRHFRIAQEWFDRQSPHIKRLYDELEENHQKQVTTPHPRQGSALTALTEPPQGVDTIILNGKFICDERVGCVAVYYALEPWTCLDRNGDEFIYLVRFLWDREQRSWVRDDRACEKAEHIAARLNELFPQNRVFHQQPPERTESEG